ncbi:MAG: hypothetical protein QM606_08745 [Leucobacter sp.]
MCLVLAGCTATGASEEQVLENPAEELPRVSIEGLPEPDVELDYENGTAITPITPYLLNLDDETSFLTAEAVGAVTYQCMTERGFDYPAYTSVDWRHLEAPEDRLFGAWDEDAAAEYGFLPDPTRGVPRVNTVDEGVESNEALVECNSAAQKNPQLIELAEEVNQPSLADRILGNAAEQAQRHPDGVAATEDFHACLQEKDIVIDPASGYVSPDYGDLDDQTRIAAAVAEASCNVDTGRIDVLYGLRAKYEEVYMEKYEARLQEALERKESIHDQLRALIDEAA